MSSNLSENVKKEDDTELNSSSNNIDDEYLNSSANQISGNNSSGLSNAGPSGDAGDGSGGIDDVCEEDDTNKQNENIENDHNDDSEHEDEHHSDGSNINATKDDEDENLMNKNDDDELSNISKATLNNNEIKIAHDQGESPERLFKKLEIVKEIKAKTLSLQRIKTKLAQEMECIETETKCLQNFQTELDLLTSEKLSHLEELKQIQNDILIMENTIKQADDEKRKALEMAKRLQVEYKPLKEQINMLRSSIGLEKTDDNDDADLIESFLNKMQPFNSNDANSNSNEKLGKSNNTNISQSNTEKHQSSANKHHQGTLNDSLKLKNKPSKSNGVGNKLPNNGNSQNKVENNLSNKHHINQPIDPIQLATVALMAHTIRSSKSPPTSQQQSSLPIHHQIHPQSAFQIQHSFGNATNKNSLNSAAVAAAVAQQENLKHFNQFMLQNQSKFLANNNSNTHNNTNVSEQSPVVNQIPSSSSTSSQIQSIQPPPFRQQPPPMKSCLSCHQQIHRNAPICPLCKAKSRSRNPKKPKNKDAPNNFDNINDQYGFNNQPTTSNKTHQKSTTGLGAKQYGDKKNRC